MGDDAEHPTNVIPAPIASEASNREQAGAQTLHRLLNVACGERVAKLWANGLL
jgi:hypothetical protein